MSILVITLAPHNERLAEQASGSAKLLKLGLEPSKSPVRRLWRLVVCIIAAIWAQLRGWQVVVPRNSALEVLVLRTILLDKVLLIGEGAPDFCRSLLSSFPYPRCLDRPPDIPFTSFLHPDGGGSSYTAPGCSVRFGQRKTGLFYDGIFFDKVPSNSKSLNISAVARAIERLLSQKDVLVIRHPRKAGFLAERSGLKCVPAVPEEVVAAAVFTFPSTLLFTDNFIRNKAHIFILDITEFYKTPREQIRCREMMAGFSKLGFPVLHVDKSD